jgi:hypothetical protein
MAKYRTAILNLTHPVKVSGYYIDEFIELVSYILINKFQLARPIHIEFKPTKSCQRASGEYIACGDPEYPYKPDIDKVIVCTQHHYRDVLRLIVHELKHVEQNHSKIYPSEYQLHREYIESKALFKDRSIHRKKEKEARDCELSTVLEFEEWQKLNGTYIKHPYNYVVPIER